MTKAEHRGLEIAKDLLRRNVPVFDIGANSSQQRDDMLAACKWIARQQAIDERRRKPRGEYRRSP